MSETPIVTIIPKMPKNIEDCIKLRGTGDCKACEYKPMKLGTVKTCNKRIGLRSF